MTEVVAAPLTTTISVSRKLGDSNYGNGEAFTSISGITKDTTPEEMEEILEQSAIAFKLIKDRIRKQAAETIR